MRHARIIYIALDINRGNIMVKIVLGIVLFLGGVATLAIDDVPVIWTGGILVGIYLIVSGVSGDSY